MDGMGGWDTGVEGRKEGSKGVAGFSFSFFSTFMVI